MRVAAVSDVHGNLPALEAVLAEVEAAGPDLVVCCGDAVAGPFPAETLALLRALGDRVRFVRGNADREVAAAASDGTSDARVRWCAQQLSPDDVDFLQRLPLTVTLVVDGLGSVVFCHGTPRSDEELVTLVTPEERLGGILADVDADVVVAGHTHSQIDRRVDRTRFVNAGSVGMPYEDEPGAYWAVLGPDVELRRTAYDVHPAAERIRVTGYPQADEFAREYVLTPAATATEAAEFFEAQAANSEK